MFKCKVILFLSELNNFIIFPIDLRNRIQTSLIKTYPVAEELLHAHTQADGQTDRINFVNNPLHNSY
jgi:hypothetical protein